MISDKSSKMVYTSILHQLHSTADKFGPLPALYGEAGLLADHQAIFARTVKIRQQLRKQGVVKTDRVALCISNGPTMAQAILAVSTTAEAVPLNPELTVKEFQDYLTRTNTKLLIHDKKSHEPVFKAARQLGLPMLEYRKLELECGNQSTLSGIDDFPESDDIALVLMTSGSTGQPKIVPLSHRNICKSVAEISSNLDLTSDDRCLCMWKQFHVGGLVDLLLAPLSRGGSVLAARHFDAELFFRIMEDWSATWFQGVPTIFADIVSELDREPREFSFPKLRFLRSVAARLDPELHKKISLAFSVPVIQTYGMTEAGPLICSTDLACQAPSGSVGKSTGSQISILDPSGQKVSPGSVGAIAIRGANVFRGYENDPDTNSTSFVEDWFLTGDLGRLDSEGYLYLEGRSKDLVNRGGEKINPAEVEAALMQHPAITDAAVFPVPHPTLGEDVAAAVILEQNAGLEDDEIRQFLSTRLAGYKLPRILLKLEKLPRNAVGKIDKIALRAIAIKSTVETGRERAPATEIETAIATIWQSFLNRNIPANIDFVSLGGDSLTAVKAFIAVENHFQTRLPDSFLSRSGSVEDLALLVEASDLHQSDLAISSERENAYVTRAEKRAIEAVIGMTLLSRSEGSSVICCANTQGSNRPLVWISNSPSPEINTLVRLMPKDQPVYGLYSGGKYFGYSDDSSQEVLAKFYAHELTKVFPNGGFILGGNCRGARLALKVAQELCSANTPPTGLCLMEYATPEVRKIGIPTLIMCAKWSPHKAYRYLGKSAKKTANDDRENLQVVWIAGFHAGIFRDDTATSVIGALSSFIQAKPVRGTINSPAGRSILLAHKIPGCFRISRKIYKIWSHLKFGALNESSIGRVNPN